MGDEPDLRGRVAIVTGGGKGIGKAIALGLARAGAKVVIAARTEEPIQATADEILAMGGEAVARVIDVSRTDQLDDLVKATVDAFGSIDILINNAARSIMRPLIDLREDAFDKVFHTNVKAVFLLSREAAKVMIGKGGGCIVNITTVAAERGTPMMAIYAASKAALKNLTMSMAVEWAAMNIRVNAVGPGMTKTEFSMPIWSNPEMERQIAARVPKGRLAEADEIVGAVLFLCSDAAAYITGQTIYVDGGNLVNA
jgi:NAD(P)-dependent dehydrogenase (short-subunit alcohol dehydrogenase family)